MSDNTELNKCISCDKSEEFAPLVSITFAGKGNWICTQCLPTLIHDPQRLLHKFKDIDTTNPPQAQ